MSKQNAHGSDRHAEKKRSEVDGVPGQEHENGVAAEGVAASGNTAEAANASGSPKEKAEVEQVLAALRDELGAKIASLEAENSALKDQYLRKAADFENFRKRMNREKQEAIDFSNQALLLDLIPIIDDFERAIKSSETAREYDNLHEGISLIERRLVSQLEAKWGLVRFDSTGERFDPNRHEAIMMDKVGGVQEPTVGEDYQRGYMLKDRVVRCAKVKVLMPLEESGADGAAAESSDGTSAGNDGATNGANS
jgi:molecular chaperone GrpE